MKKRTLILPLISMGLAVLLCCFYLFFISTYGIVCSEKNASNDFMNPNRFAYTILQAQLRYAPAEYKADYYEHLLHIYCHPDAKFDFVDSTDALALYESYFAFLEEQEAAYETDAEYAYWAPSLFTERTFTDSAGIAHTVRSDDDLYVFYFQALYQNGERAKAKAGYDAYFDRTDNLLTYRYFLTYLLSQNNLPQEDGDWARARTERLLEAIRREQADYLASGIEDRYSPYYMDSYVETAIYDLTRLLEQG